MTETELKFQVPAVQRDALRRELAGSAAVLQLRAYYVDTPDRRLAKAGMALRLRRENRRWMQTLKGRGDGLFSRFEHDLAVKAPAAGCAPVIDLNLFDGKAGAALAAALGEHADALQVLFTTDVRRTVRLLKSGRSVIEVAFDEGALHVGELQWPLCEVEFELKSGSLDDLILLARRWVARFHLWLDVRTKADRGDQLARRLQNGPVVRAAASAPALHDGTGADAALRLMVGDCLAHLLPNAAEVARGPGATIDPEHLHQTRVALRRLRSALQVFGDFSEDVDPGWNPAIKALFDRLGNARDKDALEGSVLPALQRAGAPPLSKLLASSTAEAAAALRGVACNQLLLDLVRFAYEEPAGAKAESLKRRARQRFQHLHHHLRRDADAFATLDDMARHQTRKRIKRMRYSVELVAALWPQKSVSNLLEKLRVAQELLGELNDLDLAEPLFRQLLESDARAWFAVGWIAARRTALLGEAAEAVRQLAAAPRFWRRHQGKHSDKH
jgi:inorganic triphosphatase YgiF